MRKKVILLNTHLDNIINATDRVIDKLESIYYMFKKRDDIILLWRPHPLSISTIKSMHPELLSDYCKFVECLKNDPDVIYDDSADLNRAIAISDAYLGDYSSLVLVYGVSGKPMMIMEPMKNAVLKERVIWFTAGVIFGEWIYFSAYYFNGFFKKSLTSGEIVFLGHFNTEALYAAHLHLYAFAYGDTCWFIPREGEYITLVNLRTMKMKALKLPSDCKVLEGTVKFRNLIEDGNNVWLLPGGCDSVIKLDLIKELVTAYKILTDTNYRFAMIESGARINKKTILMFSSQQNKFIELDIDTGRISEMNLKVPENSFSEIVFDGYNIWLIPKVHTAIVKWNLDDNSYTEFTNYPQGFEYKEVKFISSCYYKGMIWLLPAYGHSLIRLNPKNGEMHAINLSLDNLNFMRLDRHKRNNSFLLYNFISSGKELIINLREGNMFVSIDPINNEIKHHSLMVMDKDYTEYCEEILHNNFAINSFLNTRYIASDFDESIEQFIDFVCEEKDDEALLKDRRRDEVLKIFDMKLSECGKDTWKMIKQNIN